MLTPDKDGVARPNPNTIFLWKNSGCRHFLRLNFKIWTRTIGFSDIDMDSATISSEGSVEFIVALRNGRIVNKNKGIIKKGKPT